MSERRMGVSAALLGAAAGLAGSGVLAIAVAASPFPPITIADTVVRATPGGVATRAIEVFGHRALPLTVVGTTGLFAAASAALGWLAEPFARERRRYAGAALASAVHLPLYAAVVVALFVGDGSTDPLRSISLLVPPLGLAVAVTMLGYRRPSGERPFSRSRRQVLAAIGLTAAGLAVGWIGSVGLPSLRGRAGVRQLDLDELPAIVPGAGPFDVPGLTPELTPTDEHYVVDASIVDPVIDEDAWALSIGGLVDRPLTLSYEDLLRLPRVERTVTMECISNEIGGDLISTARWGGVRLRDLLLRAGVRDEAIEVVSRAVRRYPDSIRVDQAMLETTLIAVEMNGEQLPVEHGFPARLLVPGQYGYKQPKWLEQISVIGTPYLGYWETRGWTKEGTVKTMSRIDTLATDAGTPVAAGIAYAGDRGIDRVEVSTDGGRTWRDAEVKATLSPLTWRLWRAPLGPDRFDWLIVRATDGRGRLQTRLMSPPHPDGATGWHSVELG